MKIKIGGAVLTLPSLALLANQPAWLLLTMAVLVTVAVLGITAMRTGVAETVILLWHGASAERIAELKHGERGTRSELPTSPGEDA